MKEKVFTTYYKAIDWLHTNIVLCNNLPSIDDSVWYNFTGEVFDEEDENYPEIFQWYITDCSKDDVDWLTKNFDLLFTYSEKLDCYILAVDHYGTSWSYVACEVKTKEMADRIKEMKLTYKDLTK